MLVLTLLHRLFDLGAVLSARDILTFHLPLRATAAELALRHGLPEWNPLINGGQPILSNPNYAWFYPPTWLGLVVPMSLAPSLLVLLHAAIAFTGAWRLLRRLGCEPVAAALGGMGVAASPWFLSLSHTLNFLCGAAWLPWALAAGHEAMQAEPRALGRPLLTTAAVLALQLLAGEPVTVLLSAMALACLALGSPRTLRRTAPRLIGAGMLAALLGSVQLVPTAYRLLGSERAGISPADAAFWSTRPARLVDFVLPRFWGDAMRDEHGLWLGWNVHDRSFPYVIALYSGLLLTVLAASAIARWPIPYRAGWGLAFLLGVFLATGRNNPLWAVIREHTPLLGLVRFPDKFLVLSAAVVPIAGALAWQYLSKDERWKRATLPAAVAGLLALVTGGLAIGLALRPDVGEAFVASNSGFLLAQGGLDRAVGFLRVEALAATVAAVAVAGVLLAARRRSMNTAVGIAAVVVLAADLAWYAWHCVPTAPAGLLQPPELAREAQAVGGRVFIAGVDTREAPIQLRMGPEGQQQLRHSLEGLFPYSGTLWSIAYALNVDYDLMLTPWALHAKRIVAAAPSGSEHSSRLLGAWDARVIVVARAPSEILAELERTRRQPLQHGLVRNLRTLSQFRFVRRVGRVESPRDALDALAALDYDLRDRDACLGADTPPPADYAAGRVLAVRDDGQEIRIRYQARGPAFFVAAITYDEGWIATLEDGSAAPTCPTVLGQLGLRLPPGDHRLLLRYRDPWVRVGGSITLVTVLVAALVLRRRPPAASETPP